MSLSCEVIRDLLPLYHDGVCSGESRELVEAHLCGCADCAAVLRELRGEIELPHEEPDDGAVLKKLRKNMKRTWLRGAAAVLTAVLLVAAGWYGWWYVNDYCYYQQFAQGHEPMDSEAGSHSYSWTVDGYDFRVDVPRYPGDECGVQVTTALRDMPRNIVPGREVELSLFLGRGMSPWIRRRAPTPIVGPWMDMTSGWMCPGIREMNAGCRLPRPSGICPGISFPAGKWSCRCFWAGRITATICR